MLYPDIAPGVHRGRGRVHELVHRRGRGPPHDLRLRPPRIVVLTARSSSPAGKSKGDIEAIVLTHGHFDHTGFAERLRGAGHTGLGVRERRAAHETPSAVRARAEQDPLPVPSKALPIAAALISKRAFLARAHHQVTRFTDGALRYREEAPRRSSPPGTRWATRPSPSRSRSGRSGDAIVTLNPYTGQTGPQIVSRAATVDSERALASSATCR